MTARDIYEKYVASVKTAKAVYSSCIQAAFDEYTAAMEELKKAVVDELEKELTNVE